VVVPDDSAIRRLLVFVELESRVELHPGIESATSHRGS
jgi:hypothetical protein